MKTNSKFSLTLLTIFFVAACSLSMHGQKKSIDIETVKWVDASKSEVYDALRSLELFPKWSPFLVTDPNQKYEITGTDGELGSTYSWVGVDEKSEGHQSLTEMQPNDYVKMSCEMIKPFKGKPIFEYHLEEQDGKTKVVQNFSLKINGFNKFMVSLFGIKKKMSKTNDMGMERFKTLLESEEYVTLNKSNNNLKL